MGWPVIIAPSAIADLEEIVRYIAKENPDAGVALGLELIGRAESVGNFPEIGRTVREFRQSDLREVVCRSYRIIYRLECAHERVQIVRFWHGARGFPEIPIA